MKIGEELKLKLIDISHDVLGFAIFDAELAVLESKNASRDRFYFYYKFLAEEEIVEIVKIVSEVYRNFLHSDFIRMFVNDTKPVLNAETEDSAKFVRTVIGLDGTAMHKFLLLTSGEHLLKNSNLDLLIHLAKNKNGDYSPSETKSEPKRAHRPFCNYSEHLYILPGITDKTIMNNVSEAESYATDATYFEHTLRLMAFVAENSKTLTLAEFQKLDLLESVSTKKSIESLADFNDSRRILASKGYRSLGESMTANELRSLAMILDQKACLGNFPHEFLKNRVKAMDARAERVKTIFWAGIPGYLSDEEALTDDFHLFAEELAVEVARIQTKGVFMPVVWAAFAELYAVKGSAKTLEVARVIGRDVNSSLFSIKLYQSIVMLILEGLKAESDDYPFGWFAQLSEHAWVLSPNTLESVVA